MCSFVPVLDILLHKFSRFARCYTRDVFFYGLSTLVGCWSSIFIRRIIYKFLNVWSVLLIAQLFVVSGKVGIPLTGLKPPVGWLPLLQLTVPRLRNRRYRRWLRFCVVTLLFIRPSSDGTYYGMAMSVRPSVRPGLQPSVRPSVRHSFPHFSPTCFDILIWNFVYHFIFMHVRSSSNAINVRHFLQELCSFLTSNSYKYAVFRTFLLHALTYWVQILYLTLF